MRIHVVQYNVLCTETGEIWKVKRIFPDQWSRATCFMPRLILCIYLDLCTKYTHLDMYISKTLCVLISQSLIGYDIATNWQHTNEKNNVGKIVRWTTSKTVHNIGAYCNAFQWKNRLLFLQWTDAKPKPNREREKLICGNTSPKNGWLICMPIMCACLFVHVYAYSVASYS